MPNEIYAMGSILAILAILNTYINQRTRKHLDTMEEGLSSMIKILNERCSVLNDQITTAHKRISITNETAILAYKLAKELRDTSS